MPALKHPAWVYIAGFCGGLLGGAYNTNGPPIVLYGNCRGWKPSVFTSSLAGYLLVSNSIVIVTHFIAGNVTAQTGWHLLYAFPAMAVAAAPWESSLLRK